MSAIQSPTPLETMDCWSEDGDEFFASKRTMTRGQARAYYAQETGVPFIDIRVRTVYMKREDQNDPKWTDWEGDNPWPHSNEYDIWYQVVPRHESDFACWMVTS